MARRVAPKIDDLAAGDVDVQLHDHSLAMTDRVDLPGPGAATCADRH